MPLLSATVCRRFLTLASTILAALVLRYSQPNPHSCLAEATNAAIAARSGSVRDGQALTTIANPSSMFVQPSFGCRCKSLLASGLHEASDGIIIRVSEAFAAVFMSRRYTFHFCEISP